MWDWLKDLFKNRPITQSVVGSAIVQIVWTGVSAVIGYITTELAKHTLPGWLAILIGAAVFFLLSGALYLLSWAWSRHKRAELEKEIRIGKTSTSEFAEPKLTFEIDEDGSQVRVGSGPHEVRAIYADIKLKCFKAWENPMAIRGFHASLHERFTFGDEATVIGQEDGTWIWQSPSNKEIPLKDTWTITEPSTEYRFYHFILHLTPKIQARLSEDHFLRVTMDAVGQAPMSQTVYVDDWHVKEGGFSAISLNQITTLPPPITKIINRLKGELRSYEKTNEELGRHLTQAKEGHKVQIAEVHAALDRTKDELGESRENLKEIEKRATTAEAENLRLTNELALATPNKRLIAIANNDAADIQEAVIVTGVQFRNEIEYYKRYVDFAFVVFNQSVYDISIDDQLGEGDIIFDKQPLVGVKRIEENKAQNVRPRTTGSFTVRQHLDSGDIDAIKKARGDRRFEFHNLRIKLKGGHDFESVVKEKRLRFEFGLTKDDPVYFNYNGPFRTLFNNPISGRINLVYFTHEADLVNSKAGDIRDSLYFIMHVYIANHSKPTSIDRFRLTLHADGQSYEGKRLPLTDCRWIRQGAEEHLSERDIESQNDVTLTDTRRGWLQFAVHGVKGAEHGTLATALDIIDKDNGANRLNSLSQNKWNKNSMEQESYINGPAVWQQF